MNHAFLTGLPRCRSAWFSNLLTYDKSFFFHDAFDGLENFEEFKELMEFGDGAFDMIGVSDPSLLLFWEEVSFWYPNSKWVVIRRGFEDVVESSQKIGINRKALEFFYDKMIALENALNPLVVNFKDLNPGTIFKISEYLGVNSGHIERISQLCRMNVQVERSLIVKRGAEIASNPPTMLLEAIA